MNISDTIKFERKKKNLTQKQLAEKISKSERMIQKYESGEVTPSIDILNKISEALDCSLFDLTMDVGQLKKDVKIIESEEQIIKLAEKNNIKIVKEYDNNEDGEYLKFVYISFSNKEFKLSANEFHELSQRIIDSVITNIAAAENFNLLK